MTHNQHRTKPFNTSLYIERRLRFHNQGKPMLDYVNLLNVL
jgi:hypothetical protein